MRGKIAYDEKSCGTVLFTGRGENLKFLLIKSRGDGHCGFPKGHVEAGESEIETALRETWEETSLTPVIIDGFRKTACYPLKNGRRKLVVYFLGYYENGEPMSNPEFERYDFLLLPYEEARRALQFENARELLALANKHLKTLGYYS